MRAFLAAVGAAFFMLVSIPSFADDQCFTEQMVADAVRGSAQLAARVNGDEVQAFMAEFFSEAPPAHVAGLSAIQIWAADGAAQIVTFDRHGCLAGEGYGDLEKFLNWLQGNPA